MVMMMQLIAVVIVYVLLMVIIGIMLLTAIAVLVAVVDSTDVNGVVVGGVVVSGVVCDDGDGLVVVELVMIIRLVICITVSTDSTTIADVDDVSPPFSLFFHRPPE